MIFIEVQKMFDMVLQIAGKTENEMLNDKTIKS